MSKALLGCLARLDDNDQYNLSMMYHNGEEISQDKKEAEKWLRKSAAQGNVDAIKMLDLKEYKESKLNDIRKQDGIKQVKDNTREYVDSDQLQHAFARSSNRDFSGTKIGGAGIKEILIGGALAVGTISAGSKVATEAITAITPESALQGSGSSYSSGSSRSSDSGNAPSSNSKQSTQNSFSGVSGRTSPAQAGGVGKVEGIARFANGTSCSGCSIEFIPDGLNNFTVRTDSSGRFFKDINTCHARLRGILMARKFLTAMLTLVQRRQFPYEWIEI
ncbi:MAG: SEL1-like repeat protein [Magnetococcales bacterium]|nr:SEL1-like repeat protein [Magnetococcales bacterium]